MSTHALPEAAATARTDLYLRFQAREAELLELHSARVGWEASIEALAQGVMTPGSRGDRGDATAFLLECEIAIFQWALQVMNWRRLRI